MCHVFRCDSVPAKDIANCLRDTCRRIINEKKATSETNTSTTANNSLLKKTLNRDRNEKEY